MRVIRFCAVLFLMLLLASCAPKFGLSPINIKTELGQPVTKTESERTGNRKNVPAGVKPGNIVAHIKTISGAETWVDKEGSVYQNEKAQQENAIPPDRPKRSWAWLYWTVGILVLLITGNILLKSYFGVNPFGWLFSKILRK